MLYETMGADFNFESGANLLISAGEMGIKVYNSWATLEAAKRASQSQTEIARIVLEQKKLELEALKIVAALQAQKTDTGAKTTTNLALVGGLAAAALMLTQ